MPGKSLKRALCLTILCAFCLAAFAGPDAVVAVSMASRYVTEGRDNLAGNGIGVIEAILPLGPLQFDVWRGEGVGVHYNEMQVAAELPWQATKHTRFGFKVTRFWFDGALSPITDDTEAEVYVTFVQGRFGLLAHAYYSTDAGGFYTNIRPSALFSAGNLSFEAWAELGGNRDYVSGEANGINHLALGLDSSADLTPATSLTLTVSASAPLGHRDGATTEHVGWIGLAFLHRF
ncbi:MAG: hypothetical protein KDI19_14715 [Pseudomonadales bacterium]|nr:hypothetical protein [Pseudomonadales bacterium]